MEATINNDSTIEPGPRNGQQSKQMVVDFNSFYMYQIFALDSAVE